jgi:hypothetical protein
MCTYDAEKLAISVLKFTNKASQSVSFFALFKARAMLHRSFRLATSQARWCRERLLALSTKMEQLLGICGFVQGSTHDGMKAVLMLAITSIDR